MASTWKPRAGTTWRDKLLQEHPNHHKKVPIPARMQARLGAGTMLIPSPRDLDVLMKKVRKGSWRTAGPQGQSRPESGPGGFVTPPA